MKKTRYIVAVFLLDSMKDILQKRDMQRMNSRKFINKAREAKYIMSRPFIKGNLWSAKEVCEVLDVALPSKISENKLF